jgi:hypothetical protein
VRNLLVRWKPGIRRGRLFLIAGGVWGFAAVILLIRGFAVLPESVATESLVAILALVLGLLFFKTMFRRIVEKNMKRIHAIPLDRPCVFSFQSWRSYGLMSAMIALGVTVRISGILPPIGLGTIYVTMAVPLGISSLRLFREGLGYKQ